VDAVQFAAGEPMLDPLGGDPKCDELRMGQHPMLRSGGSQDPFPAWLVS
jgi:hypothetical protein